MTRRLNSSYDMKNGTFAGLGSKVRCPFLFGRPGHQVPSQYPQFVKARALPHDRSAKLYALLICVHRIFRTSHPSSRCNACGRVQACPRRLYCSRWHQLECLDARLLSTSALQILFIEVASSRIEWQTIIQQTKNQPLARTLACPSHVMQTTLPVTLGPCEGKSVRYQVCCQHATC